MLKHTTSYVLPELTTCNTLNRFIQDFWLGGGGGVGGGGGGRWGGGGGGGGWWGVWGVVVVFVFACIFWCVWWGGWGNIHVRKLPLFMLIFTQTPRPASGL